MMILLLLHYDCEVHNDGDENHRFITIKKMRNVIILYSIYCQLKGIKCQNEIKEEGETEDEEEEETEEG